MKKYDKIKRKRSVVNYLEVTSEVGASDDLNDTWSVSHGDYFYGRIIIQVKVS